MKPKSSEPRTPNTGRPAFPFDTPFICPACGGTTFGRDTAATANGQVGTLRTVQCHDERGRGCRWHGNWPLRQTLRQYITAHQLDPDVPNSDLDTFAGQQLDLPLTQIGTVRDGNERSPIYEVDLGNGSSGIVLADYRHGSALFEGREAWLASLEDGAVLVLGEAEKEIAQKQPQSHAATAPQYRIVVGSWIQERADNQLVPTLGPIPRCATETGGDVQLVLDGYEQRYYFERWPIPETFVSEAAARQWWEKNYKGEDDSGVGLDYTIEEVA